MDEHTKQALLQFQQTELTESLIYDRLAALEKNPDNAAVSRANAPCLTKAKFGVTRFWPACWG